MAAHEAEIIKSVLSLHPIVFGKRISLILVQGEIKEQLCNIDHNLRREMGACAGAHGEELDVGLNDGKITASLAVQRHPHPQVD